MRGNRVDDDTIFFAAAEPYGYGSGVLYKFADRSGNTTVAKDGSNWYSVIPTRGHQFNGLTCELEGTDDGYSWMLHEDNRGEKRIAEASVITIEFWMSHLQTASTNDLIVLSLGLDTGTGIFNVRYNSATRKLNAGDNSVSFSYSFSGDVETLNYIAITVDTNTSKLSLHVNGRFIEEIDWDAPVDFITSSPFYIALGGEASATPLVSETVYFPFLADIRVSLRARTNNEVLEVYNRGKQGSTRDLKPRLKLQERDFHTSSYPSRVFNSQEFSGKYNSSFDDQNTVAFNESSRLSFPSNLMSGSTHLRGKKHLTTQMFAQGNAVKSVADDGLLFTPGQDLQLFDESNKFAAFSGKATSDIFWTTGSRVSDVGEGFSQPTFSKKKIEFDFPTSILTTLTASTTNSLSYPMAYYNFDAKKWQGVGTGHELGAATAAGGDEFESINKSMLGFSNYSFAGYKDGPIDSYGFPFHPKFHATSSQILSLANTLTRPFLVEKLVLELSMSLSSSGKANSFATTENMSPGATFFMLRQKGPFSGSLRLPFEYGSTIVNFSASLPASIQLAKSGTVTYVDTLRELITFSNIKVFGANVSDDYYNLSAGDLNIKLDQTAAPGDDLNVYNVPLQKLILSSTIRAPVKYSGANLVAVSETTSAGRGEYRNGGRFNVPLLSSGREINGAFPDGQLLNFDSISYASPLTDTSKNSPYLLFPNDSIIIGFQGISVPTGYVGLDFNFSFGSAKLVLYGSEIAQGKETNQITPQPLTSDAIHETLGFDPLFDQIDSEPSYFLSGAYTDDLVVGTMVTKKGSTLTTSTRKKIGSKRIRNDTVFTLDDHTTKIYPTKVMSQSVSRTLECISADERFYDTVLPDPYQYAKANSTAGNTFICSNVDVYSWDYDSNPPGPSGDNVTTCTHAYILSDNTSSPSSGTMLYDNEWRPAFPFSPRYSSLTRVPDFSLDVPKTIQTVNVPSYATKSPATPGTLYWYLLTLGQVIGNTNKTRNFYVSNESTSKVNRTTEETGTNFISGLINSEFNSLRYFKKAFYGIGDLGTFNIPGALFVSSSTDVNSNGDALNHYYEPAIRGWKYGILNGVSQFSKAHFRRDHYGHFRDMLEQRQDSKFALVDLNEYLEENIKKKTKFSAVKVTSSPVIVSFIDLTTKQIIQPISSSLSSNISIECTSSLPYYDDNIVRNR